LKASFGLMLSGLIVSAYMRLDVLFIDYFLSSNDVAQYSLAVKLVESIYFIPSMLVLSAFPSIVNYYQSSDIIEFYKLTNEISKWLTFLSFFFMAIYFFLAKPICSFLFGPDYFMVHEILYVYGFVLMFTFQGFFIEKLILLKCGSRHIFIAVSFGLIVNLLLNYLLIPMMGVVGAAYSTILCQLVSCILYYVINPNTRHVIISVFGWLKPNKHRA